MDALIIGLELAGIGMGVVFFALALVSAILSNFHHLDRLFTKAEIPPPVAKTPELSADGAISPEVMAVISAAVAVAIQKKIRIRTVRYRQQTPNAAWHMQGRVTVMGSHAVKK